MATEETRVVLIKPGDLLLVGNVGELGWKPEAIGTIVDAFAALEVTAVFFSADIEIAKVPTDG
jgi:hypothetical protein